MAFWRCHPLDPTPYRHWLLTQGSLTRALQARCAAFGVRRIRQVLDRPFADEFALLGLPPGQPALIREVVLECARRPVVFAHTVVPLAGLRGTWRSLRKLGNRPLGAALFADPRIERFPLSFHTLNRHHPLHRAARAATGLGDLGTLRARRSLFALRRQPILVTEVFLPGVLDL
jgi:chorismate--pyruvate lyase